MNLTYNFGESFFLVDGERKKQIMVNDGQNQILIVLEEFLCVKIDHMIHQNIFYKYHEGGLQISTDVSNLIDDYTLNSESVNQIEKEEFLPHSLTPFDEVFIFNSFLHYNLKDSKFSISLSPKAITYDKLFNLQSVNNLSKTFKDVFNRRIFETKNNESFIVPLSGGMDSRLLLNLLLGKVNSDRIYTSTTGTRNCGDIIIAKQVTKKLCIESNHKINYLEDFTREILLNNYKKIACLVPLDRLLHPRYESKGDIIISGIYGDVIFADINETQKMNYAEFCESSLIRPANEEDSKIIAAYSNFTPNYRLYRTLLRCQKLTRQSLISLQHPTKVITPFLEPEILFGIKGLRESNIYPRIIKNLLSRDQQKILHQSSLSTFSKSNLYRFFERQIRKILNPKIKRPYFDEKSLKQIGIKRHEAPLNLK